MKKSVHYTQVGSCAHVLPVPGSVALFLLILFALECRSLRCLDPAQAAGMPVAVSRLCLRFDERGVDMLDLATGAPKYPDTALLWDGVSAALACPKAFGQEAGALSTLLKALTAGAGWWCWPREGGLLLPASG